jgi:uncharacterized protein
MKIQVADITEEAKELAYDEEVAELNLRLDRGPHDYRVAHALAVQMSYYRSGQDLLFRGSVRGEVTGVCARCAEDYSFALDAPFSFVLSPRGTLDPQEVELSTDDLALSFYEGKEIDITPLLHEQAILALPTRPLCGADCRGLCPRCGANLNAGPCGCAAATVAPRLAVLHSLMRGK